MFAFLPTLLIQVPLMLVMIAGIGLALARWQRHPRVSALLVIALVLQLASTLSQPILQGILLSSGRSVSEMSGVFAILGIFSSLLHAVLLGLILWAVLGWRNTANTHGN